MKSQSNSYWPNVISLARLLAACMLLFSPWWGRVSEHMILFFVAFISDALDGWLARQLSSCTPLGAFLDLWADKFLFFSAWFYLLFQCQISWQAGLCIVLLMLREWLSMILRFFYHMPVRTHGKYKTIVLGLMVLWTWGSLLNWWSALPDIIWWISVLGSFSSLGAYWKVRADA